MATEHSLWEKASHTLGYISFVFSAMALILTWRTNQREDESLILTKMAVEREQQAFAIMAAADAREQKAYDREEKRFQREQKAFEREEKYSYVVQANSIDDLEQSFSYCKPVKFIVRNLSKYASPIYVEMRGQNLWLHEGEDHPGMGIKDVTQSLKLSNYTLAVDQSHEWRFRVHSALTNPKQASLQVWINGEYYAVYNYTWKDSSKEYQSAKLEPK